MNDRTPSPEKTAEEFLDKYWYENDVLADNVTQDDIIQAMEEYASQSVTSLTATIEKKDIEIFKLTRDLKASESVGEQLAKNIESNLATIEKQKEEIEILDRRLDEDSEIALISAEERIAEQSAKIEQLEKLLIRTNEFILQVQGRTIGEPLSLLVNELSMDIISALTSLPQENKNTNP